MNRTSHWPEYAIEAGLLGLFMISACTFTGLLEHPRSPAHLAVPDPTLRRALMGLASLAVLVYSGGQFFTGMWEGLKRRSANMHTLIAVGTGVAWLYSTIALLFPQIFPDAELTDVYYDVTVVVTALVVLGLALEVKARGRTS